MTKTLDDDGYLTRPIKITTKNGELIEAALTEASDRAGHRGALKAATVVSSAAAMCARFDACRVKNSERANGGAFYTRVGHAKTDDDEVKATLIGLRVGSDGRTVYLDSVVVKSTSKLAKRSFVFLTHNNYERWSYRIGSQLGIIDLDLAQFYPKKIVLSNDNRILIENVIRSASVRIGGSVRSLGDIRRILKRATNKMDFANVSLRDRAGAIIVHSDAAFSEKIATVITIKIDPNGKIAYLIDAQADIAIDPHKSSQRILLEESCYWNWICRVRNSLEWLPYKDGFLEAADTSNIGRPSREDVEAITVAF